MTTMQTLHLAIPRLRRSELQARQEELQRSANIAERRQRELDRLIKENADLRNAYIVSIRNSLEGFKEWGDTLALYWESLRSDVLEGRLEDAQAERDSFIDTVTTYISHAEALIEGAAKYGFAPSEMEFLAPLVATAKRMQVRVVDRWKTGDDLKYLVAESLIPSSDKLDAIERKYAHTQKWQDEDDDPFED